MRLQNAAWLIERTGWTVEYIDGMDPLEQAQLIRVWDAMDRARAYLQAKALGGR